MNNRNKKTWYIIKGDCFYNNSHIVNQNNLKTNRNDIEH